MIKVLKFQASWCNPCKSLSAVLGDVNTDIPFEEVDIDENRDLAQRHNVRGVPTLIMMEDGIELKRNVGMMTKAQLELWLNN
jgi:thioredoxin 1